MVIARALACTLYVVVVGCTDATGAAAVDATPGAGAWSGGPEVAGGAVQEIGVAALAGRVYVVGGMNAGGDITASVRVYDPAEGSWGSAPSLPAPVHHANVAATGDTLLVVGSLRGVGFDALGAVWAWTPGADGWTERTPMPSPRGASAVGVVDGVIYVVGGYDGARAVAEVSAYHPDSDSWETTLPPLPEPRDHLVGAAVGGAVFAVGGRDTNIAALTGRVDAFDPETGTWGTRAPMPTPRAGGAGGVVAGSIVVVGGEGNPEPGTRGVFPQAEAYDPDADAWRVLPPMPTPRHGMGAAGVGDALYVPGGAEEQGLRRTSAVTEILSL